MNVIYKPIEVHEVQIHYKRPLISKMQRIKGAKDAVEILRNCFDPNTIDLKEYFWVLYLTTANMVLHVAEVGRGSTCGVVMNTKEILQIALGVNATAMILAHNHPSGNLVFSERDVGCTRKMQTAAKTLDMVVLDHIILSSEGYASFSDLGL